MGEERNTPAGEWFRRGDRDLETARLLLEQGGYPEIIGYHVHQAVEKYLKGLLIHLSAVRDRVGDEQH